MKAIERLADHGKLVSRLFASITVILLLVVFSAPSYAHNLWIVGDADNKGAGMVHLYFEHFVGPGDGGYLGPIEKNGKTWVRRPEGKPTLISLKMVTEGKNKYLAGSSGDIKSAPYAIDHTNMYGIYHGRLDFFHGRYIEVKDQKSLEALAESPDLAVQIVPELKDDGLLLTVLYFSVPQPKTKMAVIGPDGVEHKYTSNNRGELFIKTEQPGRYHISALVFENQAAGAFERQPFKGIMHGTTLSIKMPIEK
jgi:hypothetical protein